MTPVHLLIPAAGSGRRMGADRNKVLLELLGQPIIAWTLQAADQAEAVVWIGLICQASDRPVLAAIAEALHLAKPVHLITGGDTRQQSVYNGLQSLPTEATRVLIHDGARCLATSDLFNRCAAALDTCPGLVAAVPVKDTIKVVDADQRIEATPDRQRLWAAQTPQGFDVALLKQCHRQGLDLGWSVTDDAALFEKSDLPVQVVPGEETNLKVTTPVDLAIAEFILKQRLG
ncbi:2-C-methyl-D-erythritol 4-phosphate cytidylyltransferase [Nodosilinea sp. LEGE 06152]|uniref:2-C-methyl-D-erythritol 4-phosphate cytidylyltransferase n=1 Tax=Nodosilinea sp. LEGE 06152 TaxID=2777966 RepID=UPI0018817933|nr:2-C-methyl-D-erythritol 4-phosphate cytidylyltransferase [Nodosilinea sp. LEGE 06152]MBE9156735.1 2-C-methyl-D-erythritol 4-phosphate cytidylyltransferase [Nodosilinea sp. LEGE 06152]